MADIDGTLWALEKDFWIGGPEVYRQHLADNAVMVFSGMVLTKTETVESIANGSRWTSVRFVNQRLVSLTPDAVALIYRASGWRARDEPAYSTTVSSVYVRRDGEWKLALHQQSPESGGA